MRFLCLPLLLLLAIELTQSQTKNLAEYRDPNAAAIYSAVIAPRVQKGEVPLFIAKTSSGIDQPRDAACLRKSKVLDQSLVERFLYENRDPLSLPGDLQLGFPAKIVSGAEADGIFNEAKIDGWKKFYKTYPNSGGIFSVSAIAYDKAGTTALVYVARNCGWLCGDGWYYVMKKVGNKWTKAKIDPGCGWVS